MDGNGRWAKQRGLKRTEGHTAGEEALFDMVDGALEIGLPYLTIYAFSTENWRRPVDEVRFLMNFNETLLLRRREELIDRGVKIRFLGRRSGKVPARIRRRIEETEAMASKGRNLTLQVAFNYGGRAEITDAVRAIAADVAAGKLNPSRISDKTIAKHLYAPSTPDPDLVIRTSGEYRTSNFLLWESAYAEYVFLDTLWPDFRRADLFDAIAEYQQRERRFGGT